jgi:hypothetical protein
MHSSTEKNERPGRSFREEAISRPFEEDTHMNFASVN